MSVFGFDRRHSCCLQAKPQFKVAKPATTQPEEDGAGKGRGHRRKTKNKLLEDFDDGKPSAPAEENSGHGAPKSKKPQAPPKQTRADKQVCQPAAVAHYVLMLKVLSYK